jgi:hypothetical protein
VKYWYVQYANTFTTRISIKNWTIFFKAFTRNSNALGKLKWADTDEPSTLIFALTNFINAKELQYSKFFGRCQGKIKGNLKKIKKS